MPTSSMRRPDQIYVACDNAPGFKSLLLKSDLDLEKLKIKLIKTDELNKNANAVIDKGCQELEEELKRLDPEGGKISQATLTLAVLHLNRKLRRRGNISAFEIHTASMSLTVLEVYLKMYLAISTANMAMLIIPTVQFLK